MTIVAGGSSSGVSVARFAGGLVVVPASSTGTYATITPPSGQRVALTAIAAQNVQQTNLTTIAFNGVDIVTSVKLEDHNTGAGSLAADTFSIGFQMPTQLELVGEIDEVLTISTNVATSQATYYTYQYRT
jgi:hypothetical protein